MLKSAEPVPFALSYATAKSVEQAQAVLFGADTSAAGHSESFLGKQAIQSQLRTPDFVRASDNESPSLPRNLREGDALYDAGNLTISSTSVRGQIESVRNEFLSIWKAGRVPICIGGDHLIKHAALEALQITQPKSLVIYVDAHPDIVQSADFNYCTVIHQAFSRNPDFVKAVFLVGIRQVNAAEAAGIRHWKPQIIQAQDFYSQNIREIYAPISSLKDRFDSVFLSCDLDGLDPACAPAVEAPYPSGPRLAHVIELIHLLARDFKINGVDISEIMPDRDPTRLTALACARIIKEVYSCL